MSEAIYTTDAYARTVEASVVGVVPAEGSTGPLTILDRTVFYPGGGGQPSDRGWLRAPGGRTWNVVAVRKAGDIVHELAPGDLPGGEREAGVPEEAGSAAGGFVEPPAVGERLVAEIDWPRRYALMRTHTALHALCGVVWRDYRAQVTGGNMEPGAGRMDFEFETMSADLVGRIEASVNEELAAGRDVRVRILPRDEAFAIPDLIRTKINLLPAGITHVRTVEIVGLDLQADGGTHVANTREVGPIRVTGYESKGRINKRIRIVLS